MKKLLLLSLACFCLAACETTPTVYGAYRPDTHVGYVETPIEPGRWRITFHGGPGASPERVGDLALRRAAELTLQQGYDWFRVTDRYGEATGGNGPVVSLGGGGADFGGHSAVGVGAGVGFTLGGGPRISRTIEVFMGHGATPQAPDAYDARGVMRGLGSPA